jgi:Putative peptidoglycan binding domain
MRLFFVLVCCLAIPLVARAADQDNNNKRKQTTQGQKQQQKSHRQQTTGTQSMHHNANTVSRLSNSSQSKGRGQHHALNVQNNNVPVVQSNTKGKVGTKYHGANTASRLNNSSHSKGQGQQSSTKGKVESKRFALSNSPNPKIASAKFNQNYRIQGSQNWQGQNYGAFQNYRGEWHNQGWWHNHYNRIVLISGGWYFWNAGYWYPAWGYDSAAAYYPYNGPIYAYHNLPPDQVIANVQSTLQAQGYYQGAVDGTLGPITRAALADYQQAHGLYRTEAIDEPTLESLGMS